MKRQFTLDSNIIIKSSIKKENCLDIVSFFLKNFNLNNDYYFLSPQVKRELNNIQPKISWLLLILKNKYVLKGISIKNGYNEFLSDFDDEKEKKEIQRFSNVIDYLDEKKVSEVNIEQFSKAIVQELGTFIARDIPIKPTEEKCRVNKNILNKYREYLKNNFIVNDIEDRWLIAELMFLISSNEQEIHFSTDNLKDFNYESKKWVDNIHLKNIIIYSSKDFYNQFINKN